MELDEVMRELVAREPLFHRPEWGTSRVDFERMTAPDFWEVGASGKIYGRAFVLDTLEKRAGRGELEGDVAASGFACRRLGSNCYLMTYELVQDGVRRTRRSTVWELVERDWRIVYHQGTPMERE